MKKDNLLSTVCLVGILALCFPLVARADSSWVWITETRPYDVLPFVVVGTLLIETLSIWLIPHTRRLSKVFWVVCLGNGLSYAAPYFFQLFNPVYSFQKALNTHFYNVSISFLIVTLVIEGPIEYYMLEKRDRLAQEAVVGRDPQQRRHHCRGGAHRAAVMPGLLGLRKIFQKISQKVSQIALLKRYISRREKTDFY